MDDRDSDDIKAFLAESYENINQIENYIVDLENSANTDILVNIYRYLHTIKGNCGFLAFSKLEAVAHAGESLLGKLREGKLTINAEIVTALLQTIDSIREILNNIEASSSEGDEYYSNLIQKLMELGVEGKGGQGGQGKVFSSQSPPSPLSPLSPLPPLPIQSVSISDCLTE